VGYTTATSAERPDPGGTDTLMRNNPPHQCVSSRAAGTFESFASNVDDRPSR
jgi:hypothetical protein